MTSSDEFSLVASLDLLGASKAIEDGEGNAAHYFDSFTRVSYTILSGFEKLIEALKYYAFSDSLFVVAPLDPNELDGNIIRNFGHLLSNLMTQCLLENIPLCGGVSAGWVIHGTDPPVNFQSFVAGRPLLEAHAYQEEWDWVGIGFAKINDARRNMLCNSIITKLAEPPTPWVHKYNVPIRKVNPVNCKKELRDSIETHAISWQDNNLDAIMQKLDDYLSATDPAPFGEKYRMTRAFVEHQRTIKRQRESSS